MLPIYIIIPVHNRKLLTLNCLENLKTNGDLQKYHITVVDDASSDNTAEEVNTLYPSVAVLNGDGNLWWTGAIAKGMRYAASQQAKFVIWLNDDCILEPNTLSNLVEFLYGHPKTIAGAVCYSLDTQTLEETGAQGRQRVTAKPGEVVSVNEMSGYCVGIPVEVINAIGVPNQSRYPHYYGDCTYILRANRAGFSAYILGDVKVAHQSSQLDFKSYIGKLRSTQSKRKVFKELFFSNKSPFLLKSNFFYCIEKYGIIQGFCLFMVKTIIRLFYFCL